MGNQYISGPQPQGTRGNVVSFIHIYDRDPTPYDVQGFFLLDWWLNKAREAVWVLVSREGTSTSMGPLAHWVELTAGGSGTVIGLRDQAGNPVNADVNGYINVIGDNTYIQTVANAGTHTLTINLANPTTYVKTLTGNNNTEHVGPTGGDIQVIGDTTTIDIQGDAGTHTLTASVIKGDKVLWTLKGDDGVVVTPLAGNIDVKATIYSGSTLQFEGSTPNTLNLQVTDASDNILIGFGAGNATLVGTGALNNVGTGVLVGHSLNAGHDNSMYGWEAGNHIDDGNLNSLFGSGAGAKITSGNENTAISTALTNLTTGSSNIAIGSGAGSALTTEDDCVLIAHAGIAGSPGLVALSIPNVTHFMHNFGNNNTFLGNAAGNFTLTSSFSTGAGANALNGLTSGDFNTAVGNSSQSVVDVGSGNSSLGDSSLIALKGGNNNVVAGQNSMTSATSSSGCVVLGQGSLTNLLTGSNHIIIGQGAGNGYTSNESQAILIGQGQAGVATEVAPIRIGQPASLVGTTDGNIFMGVGAGSTLITVGTSVNNVCAGTSSGVALTTGANNSFYGSALTGASVDAGSRNVVAGAGSFLAATSSNNCTVVGEGSATNLLTGSNNLILGQGAGNFLIGAESNNILFGSAGGVPGASSMVQGQIPGGSNFMIVQTAGGAQNNFFGEGAGNLTLSGTRNTSLGWLSLSGLTSGGANTVIGQNSGAALNSGSNNTFIGASSGVNATSCISNVMIGQNSLGLGVATGQENVGIGFNAANRLTSATNNSLIGNSAGAWITTGSFNTCNGDTAFATGIGGLTTGSYNLAFGHNAGSNYTAAESSNILINHPGVNGENNTMRIGMSGGGNQQINRAFIAGIRGITTGVADALPVLVDSADQLGTISSSRKYKENIHDLGNQSEIIYDLRPVAFNFKNDPLKTPAWGLIAEEVDAVFPRLAVYGKNGEPESVKYHDLPVLLLNEIKKLRARIEVLEATCYTKKDS